MGESVLRMRAILIAVVVAAAGTMHAQMKPVPAHAPLPPALQTAPDLPIESARRISRDDALRLTAKGEAVFVDVRSLQSYTAAHIRGAISIPQSKLLERLSDLPPRKMLITYCACKEEHTAALAVLFYNRHGIKNVAALRGGWKEWYGSGLPVESGAPR